MRKIINFLYIIIFSITLMIIPIFSILNIRTTDDQTFILNERRQKNKLEALKLNNEGVRSYFKDLDLYINDRFAFRADLLSYNNNLMYKIGVSTKPEKIVLGKQGWLYLGNSHAKTISKFRGLVHFDSTQLSSWFNYFITIQNYLKSKNILSYIVIAPDKQTIYPEYLPDYISRGKKTPYDQIIENSKSLNLIDLREPILNEKNNHNHQLYMKSDSHWNDLGAYIAYSIIMDRVKLDLNIDPIFLDSSSYHIVESKTSDLMYLGMGSFDNKDENPYLKPNAFGNNKIKVRSVFDDTWVEHNANKNINKTSILVSNKRKNHKLLVIGDSFTDRVSKYYNNTFGEVRYVHNTRYDEADLSSIIDTFKPDLVILEYVERSLPNDAESLIPLTFDTMNNSSDIISLGPEQLYKGSNFNRNVSEVRLLKDGLKIISTNDDPYFQLPLIPLPKKNINIKLDITVQASTNAQVFYKTNTKKNYNSENSVTTSLTSGRKQLTFVIPNNDIIGRLRLDPGNVKGEYIIHNIEIFENK